jgi:hypothetical protein
LVGKGTAVILGELLTHDEVITVYDLAAEKVTDVFFGDDMTLSPDSSYMAFSRFYPRMMPPEFPRSAVALLYDLRESAAGNRVQEGPEKDPERAGIPIFPINNAKNRVLDPDPSKDDVIWSKFSWSAGGRLGFLVRRTNGDLTAVLGTLSPHAMTVCEKIVDRQAPWNDRRELRFSFYGESIEVRLGGGGPVIVDGASCDAEYRVGLK